jgi:hypothetical protein
MNRPSETADEINGPSHEEIATLAYSIWMSEGCPEGREEANWKEAEQQRALERSADTFIEDRSDGPPVN